MFKVFGCRSIDTGETQKMVKENRPDDSSIGINEWRSHQFRHLTSSASGLSNNGPRSDVFSSQFNTGSRKRKRIQRLLMNAYT